MSYRLAYIRFFILHGDIHICFVKLTQNMQIMVLYVVTSMGRETILAIHDFSLNDDYQLLRFRRKCCYKNAGISNLMYLVLLLQLELINNFSRNKRNYLNYFYLMTISFFYILHQYSSTYIYPYSKIRYSEYS